MTFSLSRSHLEKASADMVKAVHEFVRVFGWARYQKEMVGASLSAQFSNAR